MRFTFALLAVASASVASASLLPRQASYPNCAIPCLTSADFGSCSQTDLQCLCTSSSFISSTTQCIESSCTGSDLDQAEAAARSGCAAIGITLTSSIAPATSSAASSAAASATSPSASAASSAASSSASPSASTSSSGAIANGLNIVAGAAAALGAVIAAL